VQRVGHGSNDPLHYLGWNRHFLSRVAEGIDERVARRHLVESGYMDGVRIEPREYLLGAICWQGTKEESAEGVVVGWERGNRHFNSSKP
jgi:hypothetical protein